MTALNDRAGFAPLRPAGPREAPVVLVNAPGIADGTARIVPPPPAPPPLHPPAANTPLPKPPPAPFSHRPRGMDSGLRLLPLASFCWGTAPRGMPRARGDHVLIRVADGCLTLRLPGGTNVLGPGTLRYLPAGTAFAALPGPGAVGQVLLVGRGAVSDGPALPEHPLNLRPSTALTQILDADLAALALALRRNGPEAVEEAQERLGLLARSLRRAAAPEAEEETPHPHLRAVAPLAVAEAPEPLPPAPSGAGAHALIAAFLALVAAEPGRGWTIADHADALGCSAAALDRACLAIRGRRALDLLYAARLEAALEMLRANRLTLGEIAARLGYTGPGHLNRAIIAATGRGEAGFRGS